MISPEDQVGNPVSPISIPGRLRRPPCCRKSFSFQSPGWLWKRETNRARQRGQHKATVARNPRPRATSAGRPKIWFTSSLTGSDTERRFKGVKRRQQASTYHDPKNHRGWRAQRLKRRGLMPSPTARAGGAGEPLIDSQPPQHGLRQILAATPRPPAKPRSKIAKTPPSRFSAPTGSASGTKGCQFQTLTRWRRRRRQQHEAETVACMRWPIKVQKKMARWRQACYGQGPQPSRYQARHGN